MTYADIHVGEGFCQDIFVPGQMRCTGPAGLCSGGFPRQTCGCAIVRRRRRHGAVFAMSRGTHGIFVGRVVARFATS
jgi:hypothetical protein